MDTLKASQELQKVGLSTDQADAISRLIYDLGRSETRPSRADLVTKDRLDVRLLQHSLFMGVAAAVILALFKLV